ncbi:MlaD family protein [Azospirillum sp. A26]|uniref:MlaD family protein n=1 Tax=Azospirillum sp. A26 TaxID=3160607 RepID=UPI00366AC584
MADETRDNDRPDPHSPENQPSAGHPLANHPPEVATPPRRRLSPLWLLPLVAALIAGWLGWRWFEERGPQIVITFQSGDGLEAGRTRIKHKNVDLGVIELVRLSDDLSQVIATARMDRTAARHLKDGTRFWMVAPRLGLGGVSGLSTVVSGTYVEMEPAVATTGGSSTRWTSRRWSAPTCRAAAST